MRFWPRRKKKQKETQAEAPVTEAAVEETLSLEDAVTQGLNEAAETIRPLISLSDPFFKAVQELDASGTLPIYLNPKREFRDDSVLITTNASGYVSLDPNGRVYIGGSAILAGHGIDARRGEESIPGIMNIFLEAMAFRKGIAPAEITAETPYAEAFNAAAEKRAAIEALSDPLFNALQKLDASGTLPVSLNPKREFDSGNSVSIMAGGSRIGFFQGRDSVWVDDIELKNVDVRQAEKILPQIVKVIINKAALKGALTTPTPAAPAPGC